MTAVLGFLTELVAETARIFYEGSLYILLGFLIAGLLHEFLPADLIARHLGREDPRSVATAALLGAPIPLCSCGVLPASAALRRKGAAKSPTMSFLVSTPETGVDSIALTYGLFGGVMAVVRPLVAVATAMLAGLLSMRVPGGDEPLSESDLGALGLHEHAHAHRRSGGPPSDPEARPAKGPRPKKGRATGRMTAEEWGRRLDQAIRYGFVTLFDDLAFWLLLGLGLTGVLSATLPDDFFSATLGLDRGLLPMLLVILAGVPLYLCASASTPVAAALVAKGLSPGAALVFLLVGPATNAATIAVVGRLLGGRRLRIYLGAIIAVALVAGLLLDLLAADVVRRATAEAFGGQESDVLSALKVMTALGFSALLLLSGRRTRFQTGRNELRDQVSRLGTALRHFHPAMVVRPLPLSVLVVVGLLVVVPNALLVVQPGQRGIVQRFGRVVDGSLAPGLHVHWPPPIGAAQSVDVARIRQVEVGRSATLGGAGAGDADPASYYVTADENLIDIRAVVHYRVSDPVRFALGVEDADPLLENIARRQLIRIASGSPIDELYTSARGRTEGVLQRGIAQELARLDPGIELVSARLLDVHAPVGVHGAFRDVASAIEDREREIHEGSAHAVEAVAGARGEAARVLEEARAASARLGLLARADTAAFVQISEVHRLHPRVTETRLHLETLERSLWSVRKYIDGTSASSGELDLWVGAAGGDEGAVSEEGADGRDARVPLLRRRNR